METNPVPMDLKSTTLLTNKSTREEDFKKKNSGSSTSNSFKNDVDVPKFLATKSSYSME